MLRCALVGGVGCGELNGAGTLLLRSCSAVVLLGAGFALSACAPSGSNDSGAVQDNMPAKVTNEPAQGMGSPAVGVRSSAIVPGRAARVFIFAGVDPHCASLPEPELILTKPPAKGDVSFRPGQATKLAATASGTCIGSKAVGTGVYYTARSGASGSDSFTVSASLASGETMTRDFHVLIAD